MYYGSVSKPKITLNNIKKSLKPTKEMNLKVKNTKINALTVDKDVTKTVIKSFRPGIIPISTATKFKTSKNSRKNNFYIKQAERSNEKESDNRNFSLEREVSTREGGGGGNLLIQNYLNGKNNNNSTSNNLSNSNFTNNTPIQKNNLKEITEEPLNGIEYLVKNKLMRKKEKIKTNLLNFSNPYSNNNKFYNKISLEKSNSQFSQYNQNEIINNHSAVKKEPEINRYDDKGIYKGTGGGMGIGCNQAVSVSMGLNPNTNPRRCNSSQEEVEDTERNEKKMISPRMNFIINKYYDIFDKKKESTQVNANLGSTSLDMKNCKNSLIKNNNQNSKFSQFSMSNEYILNTKIDLGVLNSKIAKQKYTSNLINNSNNTSILNNNSSYINSIPKTGNNLSNTQKTFTCINNNANKYAIQNTPDKFVVTQATQREISKQKISKTTYGTKNNSRKNSIEKNLLAKTKNMFLAVNYKNSLKTSINTSTNNSSSTLLSNNQNKNLNSTNADICEKENHSGHGHGQAVITPYANSKINIKHSNSNNINSGENSEKKFHQKPFHNKGLSEVPILSNMEILNLNNNTGYNNLPNKVTKNILCNNLKYFNNTNNKNMKSSSLNSSNLIIGKNKNEDYVTEKKKLGQIANTAMNSKSNSKSVSRVEEIQEPAYSNIYAQSKQNINKVKNPISMIKKYIPITTSHSPTNSLSKDLFGFGAKNQKKKENSISVEQYDCKMSKRDATGNNILKDKNFMKINLDLNNLRKDKSIKTKISHKEEFKNSLDDIFDNSSDSIKSTIRESNYYRRESEKVTNYIKRFYQIYAEYPKTNQNLYKFGRLLGRGAFGKVNIALHILSGRLVAIKSFNKSKLISENSKRKIPHEINILKNLKHNSVVRIFDTFETKKHILIVMEYVSCGDLLSFVRKRSKLNENTAKFIFKQIVEALQFIHSLNVVHRDIKLDNILIDLQNNIKICDFGVSKQIKKGDVMHDQCGTPAYIAPEILKNQGYENFGVDVWSAGVVLYAMLSGTVPFKANNINDLHKLILKGNFQQLTDCSEEVQNLILCLLEVDPKKRISLEQILLHPWIKSNDKNKSKMNLFTAAEKILFAKSNIDFRYANRDDIIENFTLKNLDTLQETENQNINTKSVILAPFNSSMKIEDSFLNIDINIENEVLKFCGKAKELNRNYELNNNGEIDNGIIILQNEDNMNILLKNDSNKQIYSPFLPSPYNNSFNNNKIISKPITPVEIEDNKENKESNLMNNKNKENPEESIQKSLIKNGNNLHSLNNHLAINERILKELENLGYNKEFTLKSLLNNEINYVTTAYYLFNSNVDYRD